MKYPSRSAAGGLVVMVAGLVFGGCRPIPPPDVLATIDEVRRAPAAAQAKASAPDVYAEGDRLRREARRAYDDGDVAGAQIIGEQALAAYEEAVAVARGVRAEQRRVAHEAASAEASERLSALEVEHQSVAAEIAALEKRLVVLQAINQPLGAGQAAGARREAREEATRTLALEARLLCLAGTMLAAGSPKPDGLNEAEASLGALDPAPKEDAETTPDGGKGRSGVALERAMRARSACLRGLSLVRRKLLEGSGTGTDNLGGADALLDGLGEAAIPSARLGRDERGVTVSLFGAFDRGEATLSEVGRRQLEVLSEVAARFEGPPLLVVVHGPPAGGRNDRRGTTVVTELRRRAGADRVPDATLAGAAQPLVDPEGPLAAQNERIDVVFVTAQLD
ncbi:MAG: hypothetical protein AAF715_16595 [Myxococcota bacterium]